MLALSFPLNPTQGRILPWRRLPALPLARRFTDFREDGKREPRPYSPGGVGSRLRLRPHFVPGFEIAGAEQSGGGSRSSFFDFMLLADGCLGIALGRARGHGLDSAVARTLTRAYLRSFAAQGLDVGDILTRADKVLSQSGGQSFVDMLLLRLHPLRRSFVYASAGPVRGFLLGEAGNLERALEGTRSPLGALRKATFCPSGEIAIPDEGLLLLLADGSNRAAAPDGCELGAERALAYVSTHLQDRAQELVEGLHGRVRRDDEIASVVVKAAAEEEACECDASLAQAAEAA
jgi:hypothetical protein